jgi:hypothetical protein
LRAARSASAAAGSFPFHVELDGVAGRLGRAAERLSFIARRQVRREAAPGDLRRRPEQRVSGRSSPSLSYK